MCGIASTILPRMSLKLQHRGPDGIGSTGIVLPWSIVTLEQTRLAIVDQTNVPLPFDYTNSCGVIIAYNGEVWNTTIKTELYDGIPWETTNDAEIIARAWRKWGVDCLKHLNFMGCFVLVDKIKNEIFIARDRIGEKFLYYTQLGSGISLASEVIGLPINFEETQCLDAEVLECDFSVDTPFKGVKRLAPGHYIHLKNENDLRNITPVSWWQYGTEIDESMTWQQAVDQTHELLVDAVKIRIPNVKYGVLCSGGLDSAIVQSIAKADLTYCCTFPEIDNLTLAKLGAGRSIPTPVTFGYDDLIRVLPDVAYHTGTPATWSAVCLYFLYKQMAIDGCKVNLAGEIADEEFGGYGRYTILYYLNQAKKDSRLMQYSYAFERQIGTDKQIIAKMLDRSLNNTAYKHAEMIVQQFSPNRNLCQDAMICDLYTSTQILLRNADTMAAASSIENRNPFADVRILELSSRMPLRYKITPTENKAVLRAVARRLGVAAEIVDEKNKKGLAVPWSNWTGAKGWDRTEFAERTKAAWREVFKL